MDGQMNAQMGANECALDKWVGKTVRATVNLKSQYSHNIYLVLEGPCTSGITKLSSLIVEL